MMPPERPDLVPGGPLMTGSRTPRTEAPIERLVRDLMSELRENPLPGARYAYDVVSRRLLAILIEIGRSAAPDDSRVRELEEAAATAQQAPSLYPPTPVTDGVDHVHDPEQCAGCRRQADLFFDGGTNAERLRATAQQAPPADESIVWLADTDGPTHSEETR